MPKSKYQKRLETLERQYQLELNIFNSGHCIKILPWVFDTIHNLPVNLQEPWAIKFDTLVLMDIERNNRIYNP